uniref:Plasmodium vivax Vir protein n=1 Tax=Rhabditophanes sp. KR3021 TaxID=114890 RepID=A0AC35TR27_9BILA
MKKESYFVLILCFILTQNFQSGGTSILDITCQRHPTLRMCGVLTYQSPHRDDLTSPDKTLIKNKSKQAGRFTDTASQEVEDSKDASAKQAVASSAFTPSSKKVSEYCNKYMGQFADECTHKIDLNDRALRTFCNSYIQNCEPENDNFEGSSFGNGSSITTTPKPAETTIVNSNNSEDSNNDKDLESLSDRKSSDVHKNPFAGEVGSFSTATADEKTIYEYCAKYNKEFATRCTVKIDSKDEELKKFCNSYISHCSDKMDQLEKFAASTQPPAISVRDHNKKATDEFEAFIGVDKKKKKLRACTPDCDPKIFKHCTTPCKCDYEYPAAQRFCNPPPMPLFLETCRLWYYRCPKYEQYNYASQFVYSKANKGKVLPGSTKKIDSSPGTSPFI